ncbi:MAG: YceI family protein [Microthrixaceae bacterium]
MSTVTAPSGKYTIDPTHSRIGFVARHAMVTKVRGSFNEFDGSGYLDAENPANSKLELTIQAASIDTRSPDRDAHLRSNDFFDMEAYPEIKFVSTAIEQTSDDEFKVTGDLTIGSHQARQRRLRVHRICRRPVPEPSHRPGRQDHGQPQGLGRQLERRPRGRWRARE